MSKKAGSPIILGMGDNPSSKDLVEYEKKDDKTGGKRKSLKKKSLKKKSLKKKSLKNKKKK